MNTLSRLIVPVALVLLAACKEEEKVVTYTVPREKERPTAPLAATAENGAAPVPAVAPVPTAPPAMPANADLLAQQRQFGQPAWTAPAHWRADTDKPMRKGSWTIPGKNGTAAELSVTVFPGDVGGDLANVNRWRRQIGLGPVDSAALATTLTPVRIDGLAGKQVRLEGVGQTVIGVILPRDGATWFFKFTGDNATADAELSGLQAFFQSVKFGQ